MPFLDHLEELRWRLIKSLGTVLVGALITFFYIDPLIDFLIRPTRDLTTPMDLQVLKVQGMFMIKWGIALMGGVVLAIPVLTYQLWKFIVPGLYMNEKKYVTPLIIFTYLLLDVGNYIGLNQVSYLMIGSWINLTPIWYRQMPNPWDQK